MYRFKWLESDGACTGLNGHCVRKIAMLVLVWCYKARDDREQDLWRYWLSVGCIKQWFDRASSCGWSSNKCLKVEQWSSDIAVSCTLAKQSDLESKRTRFKTILSPLTTIHIDLADSSVLPLLFLRSLNILSGCPIINIHSCHQDRKLSWVGLMEYHAHTGFHYCILFPYLCHDCRALAIFQAWIWVGVVIGKSLTSIQIRYMVRLFEF